MIYLKIIQLQIILEVVVYCSNQGGFMNNVKKIRNLENKVVLLQYELEVIKSILCDKPDEGNPVIKKAYQKGLNHSPYGESLDMIRFLDFLDKLGLLE